MFVVDRLDIGCSRQPAFHTHTGKHDVAVLEKLSFLDSETWLKRTRESF
jgi:hypothetical protein